MTLSIAVPSEAPGGLDAPISSHFGHCDVFTLIDVEDGGVVRTSLVTPPDHESGGCLAPVAVLAAHGITAILTGGMGARPLRGFLDAGIQPYFVGDCDVVGDAARAFVAGRLPAFVLEQSCGGGEGGCCGGHDHDH